MVTQSIPLVADLRTQNRNIGVIYLATGLATEGDTGGGIYFWNPSSTNADDGFYYLQVTGVATGRWVRIYAGSNIYNTDGSLLDNRDVTLNGNYLKFIGSSANSTFNADGSVTLGSLSGVNTRMVVAGATGMLSTQSFIPGTTIRFVEKFTATLGQTIFNTTNTLYGDLFDVFLNGVKLNTDSFSFTANQIVLVDGSYAGDIIDVVGFSSITVYATLPSQTGNAGKYLFTDGNSLSWQFVSGGFVPYTGAIADVNLGEFGLTAGQLTLDVSPTGTAAVGTTRWNNTIGSSETTLKGGSVILKNGVDLVARVVNKVTPNTTLTKAAYQAVKVSGAQGQRLAVSLAQANNDANSADTIGLVTETIANNQEGFIMTVGNLEGINTTGSLQGETWADGDVLYLSPTTAGVLTNVKPNGSTGHIVVIGYVEYAHANNGKIYVKIMNGWELDELHNVYISSVANNDALIYESSTSLWKNKTIATALGYTPVPSTRTLTINGTAYDLSADRSWTVSGGGTTIYSGDGTLTSARTVTSGGFPLTFTGSNTAATAIARGLNLTHTLVAAANNDVLVGLDINPTFTNGAFTGVENINLRLVGSGSRSMKLRGGDSSGNAYITNDASTQITYTAGYGGHYFAFNNGVNSSTPLTITHNLIHGGNNNTSCGNSANRWSNVFSVNISSDQYQFQGTTAMSFTGLVNTGIYFDLTNKVLQFSTNNSEKFRITSAGRLLLGTTTESTYLLDVNGTARVSGKVTVSVSSANPLVLNRGLTSTAAIYLDGAVNACAYGNGTDVGGAGSEFLYLSKTLNSVSLYVNSTQQFRIFSTGNTHIQNGGTYTDIASALLAVNSTTKGFLPPRMTTTEKNAIATPAAGLMVFDTTLAKLCVYSGTAWETITSI